MEYILQIRRTLLQILLLVVIEAGIAFGAGWGTTVPSLLLGSLANVIYYLLMCYRVKRCSVLSAEKAVSYMQAGWMLRLGFIVLILVLSTSFTQVNFLMTVVGLFSLQLVLFFNAVVIVTKSALILKRKE